MADMLFTTTPETTAAADKIEHDGREKKMTTQFQFQITDPALDVPPMAFPTEEARDATLNYILADEFHNPEGKALDSLAQIIFTRVDDGKFTIERALQRGKDVTSRARIA